MSMIGIDVALELLHAVRRKALDELTQRSEGAGVQLPNVLDPAVVGIADTAFEFELETVAEELLDIGQIAPGQRR